MAESNYKSTENYQRLSSCFIRLSENQVIVGQGPVLSVIRLTDRNEIQVADIYDGLYVWEIDFKPAAQGTSLVIRGVATLGSKKSGLAKRQEQKLTKCGPVTTDTM